MKNYDNFVDVIAIVLCTYVLFTTYREKGKAFIYKVSWSMPFGLGLAGAILDLAGSDSSPFQEQIFKVALITSVVWALVLEFIIYSYLQRKENDKT